MAKAGLFLYARRKLHVPILKEYYHCYTLLDNKNGRQGARRDVDTLFEAFCLINRFIPKTLISRWLEYNEMHLRKKGHLMGDEFIFLACNSYDKKRLIRQKVTQPALSLKKSAFNGTFPIDSVPCPSFPELNLNKIVEFTVNSASVLFDVDNPVEVKPQETAKPKRVDKVNKLDRVRAMMKSPQMYDRVKIALKQGTHLQHPRKVVTTRPSTAMFVSGKKENAMSRVSTAVSLKKREEPFHIMTLREAAVLSYIPKSIFKRPVSRHTYNS